MTCKNETSAFSLASEKTDLLHMLKLELGRFVEGEDIPAEEITASFDRAHQHMECIRKIDRLLSEFACTTTLDPELLKLQDEQRMLAKTILKTTRLALEKAERLAADCRVGLAGVQQKKWICAQFAAQPMQPGSLLDYSEKLRLSSKK